MLDMFLQDFSSKMKGPLEENHYYLYLFNRHITTQLYVKLTLLDGVFKMHTGSFHCDTEERNPTSIHEDVGLIPGPIQWVKDLVLLWL